MAKWSDRLNQMTQSAISKSKEVAGVAKLNVDNTTLNLDIKNIQTQIGAYVLENNLLQEDASIGKWMEKVEAIKAKIEQNNEKIRELKSISVCPECGAEVSREGRFCKKCGAELTVPASAAEVKDAENASKATTEEAAGTAEPEEEASGAETAQEEGFFGADGAENDEVSGAEEQ